jgi:GNAT superfamily N-acetyltransferase
VSFQIRKARKSDCPLILDFIKLLARYEKLENEVSATIADLENTLFNANPVAEVFFAFEGETAVGFALIFQNYSTFLARPGIYLEDLYVKEEYRGKGYGKELLKFIAGLAVERNCGRFEWSVLNWNKPAIDFYKSLGAVAMDEWTVYRVTGEALAQLAKR